ncbi:MAG: hypothetical protein AB1668_02340 [Nanoarchaeota archaeon]
MTSKRIVAFLVVLGIVFSAFSIGLNIGKQTVSQAVSDKIVEEEPSSSVAQGKVSFYVLEKLEPQQATGKVTFKVVSE